jgi:hypothetical protein
MALCAICGVTTISGEELCPYHPSSTTPEDWAASNRVLCDFIHRGVEPQRLALADRDDDFWPAPVTLEEPHRPPSDSRVTRRRNTGPRRQSRGTRVEPL